MRRRPATVILYEETELAEGTRRQRAYKAWPTRCPQLFEELCALIPEPAREHPENGGAPSIPLQARAYALLIKVQFRFTYAELSDYLAQDRTMQRLGWLPDKPLSITTLHTISGDRRLLPVFNEMINRTAYTGRRIEDTAIIDASELPNSFAGNYNEEKYGKKRKRGRTYIKFHCSRCGALYRSHERHLAG